MNVRKRRQKRGATSTPTDLGRLVPNRLSIELRPNRLSILEGRPGRRKAMPGEGQTVPATVSEPSARRRTVVRPARRRISLSTLVFVALIAFWVLSRILEALRP